MAGENPTTTFDCLGGGTHTFTAGRTEQGKFVELDGQRKGMHRKDVPSVALMGNEAYFSSHEHCLWHAHDQVQAVLDNVEANDTSAALREQTNALLEAGLAAGAPASDLLMVHALGRALESGDPQRMQAVAELAGLDKPGRQER